MKYLIAESEFRNIETDNFIKAVIIMPSKCNLLLIGTMLESFVKSQGMYHDYVLHDLNMYDTDENACEIGEQDSIEIAVIDFEEDHILSIPTVLLEKPMLFKGEVYCIFAKPEMEVGDIVD